MSSRAGDRSFCATEVALHSHLIIAHGVFFGIGELSVDIRGLHFFDQGDTSHADLECQVSGEKSPVARECSYTSTEHHLLGP
jgi:hypothetical protein